MANELFSFSVIGTVASQNWVPMGKNSSKQVLEIHVVSVTHDRNGDETQNVLPVKFFFNSENAARWLIPGTRVCIIGDVAGKQFDGQYGPRVYVSLNAKNFSILPPAEQPKQSQRGGYSNQPPSGQYQKQPQRQQQYQQPSQRQEVVVTDEDIPKQNDGAEENVPF